MFRLRQGDTCILSASCVLPAITFDVEIEAQTEVDAVLIPGKSAGQPDQGQYLCGKLCL